MAPHKFFAPYLLAKLHHESGNRKQAEMIANELLQKEVKVHSTAIEEIKQEMKDITTLTDQFPINPQALRTITSSALEMIYRANFNLFYK